MSYNHDIKLKIFLAGTEKTLSEYKHFSTECFSRESVFKSQHPYSSSQPFVTPVPGDLTSTSSLPGHCTHTVQGHTHRQKNSHT